MQEIDGMTELEYFIQELKTQFIKDLQLKTAWGKNEVEKQFEQSLNKTLLRMLGVLRKGQDA